MIDTSEKEKKKLIMHIVKQSMIDMHKKRQEKTMKVDVFYQF
jgi:hypothetical protein